MALLKAGRLSWNVEEWGDSASVLPPLLFLHGFTGRGGSWRRLAARFAPARRCVAPDLPGHGLSDPPPEGYDLERAADDLSAVLEALGVPCAAVVGYSMGGRLALHLAARFPAKVERLALAGASPGIATDRERAVRAEADDEWSARLLAEGIPSFVAAWMAQPLFATQASMPAEAFEALRREKLEQRADALAAALRAFGAGRQRPLHAELPRLVMPVLLIVGELDSKYRAIAAEMAAALPNARIAIVRGAGHAPQVEEPELFLAAATAFLEAASSEG